MSNDKDAREDEDVGVLQRFTGYLVLGVYAALLLGVWLFTFDVSAGLISKVLSGLAASIAAIIFPTLVVFAFASVIIEVVEREE